MDIIGRLKGDPEERPVDQGLVIPDTDLEPDEIVPDEGDSKEVGNGEASA